MSCPIHPTGLDSLEPVFIMTETGRREVAYIRLCGGKVFGKYGQDSCYKVLGGLQRIAGGSAITDVAWSQMLETRKCPPFVFVRKNGKTVPENWREGTKIVSSPAPQEKAAGDAQEPEPDYGSDQ